MDKQVSRQIANMKKRNMTEKATGKRDVNSHTELLAIKELPDTKVLGNLHASREWVKVLGPVFPTVRGPGGAPWGDCQEPRTGRDGYL